jgi:hypothetical protein
VLELTQQPPQRGVGLPEPLAAGREVGAQSVLHKTLQNTDWQAQFCRPGRNRQKTILGYSDAKKTAPSASAALASPLSESQPRQRFWALPWCGGCATLRPWFI